MTWASLQQVLRDCGLIEPSHGARDVDGVLVSGVAYDSRDVKPGDVFVALKGQRADGTQFARQAIERGAVEGSSDALALHRVDGVRFAAGVFTNLTRDHLDFHPDMEAYFQAKRRLFEMLPSGAPSLINLDDPRGPSLVEMAGRPVTYAIN